MSCKSCLASKPDGICGISQFDDDINLTNKDIHQLLSGELWRGKKMMINFLLPNAPIFDQEYWRAVNKIVDDNQYYKNLFDQISLLSANDAVMKILDFFLQETRLALTFNSNKRPDGSYQYGIFPDTIQDLLPYITTETEGVITILYSNRETAAGSTNIRGVPMFGDRGENDRIPITKYEYIETGYNDILSLSIDEASFEKFILQKSLYNVSELASRVKSALNQYMSRTDKVYTFDIKYIQENSYVKYFVRAVKKPGVSNEIFLQQVHDIDIGFYKSNTNDINFFGFTEKFHEFDISTVDEGYAEIKDLRNVPLITIGTVVEISILSPSTVIHEFCHVLGLCHTHQTFNNPILWNNDILMQYFRLAVYPDQTDEYIQNKINVNYINKDTDIGYNNKQIFDPLSIMTYDIDCGFSTNNIGTRKKYKLSPQDIILLKSLYPYYNDENVIVNVRNNSEPNSQIDNKSKNIFNILLIAIIIIIIILIAIFIWKKFKI